MKKNLEDGQSASMKKIFHLQDSERTTPSMGYENSNAIFLLYICSQFKLEKKR